MRAERKSGRVIIDIMHETRVESDGSMMVTTTVTSHGNAQYTTLGRLNTWERGWYVAETGPDGKEFATLFTDTKAEAIKAFEQRAVAQAAKWAAA